MGKLNLLNTIILALFSLLSLEVIATDSFDELEQEQYNQGIVYRNQKQYEDAKKQFLPLAEQGHLKAQHNLAMCSYNLGDEREAYFWFSCASDKGFEFSQNNLTKMNLLYLLLPNEILARIAYFLKGSDFASFMRLSKRSYQLAISPALKKGYDADTFLENAHFEPRPKGIKISTKITVPTGSLEVHFRDSTHLRLIFEEIPFMQVDEGELYFVKDEIVKDGNELVSVSSKIERGYYVDVIADYPVKVTGHAKFPCPLSLPRQSDTSELDLSNRGGLRLAGEPKSYMNALALAEVLESFDDEVLNKGTSLAENLLNERKKDRLVKVVEFPELMQLCPSLFLICDQQKFIDSTDHLASTKPIIHISDSIENVTKLYNKIPVFFNYIPYINPRLKTFGVYSSGLFSIEKGFRIRTDGSLMQIGEMLIDEYNIEFKIQESLWALGNIRVNKANLFVKKSAKILGGLQYLPEKPKDMPQVIWENVLYLKSKYQVN